MLSLSVITQYKNLLNLAAVVQHKNPDNMTVQLSCTAGTKTNDSKEDTTDGLNILVSTKQAGAEVLP
jgi:hypothetical protein